MSRLGPDTTLACGTRGGQYSRLQKTTSCRRRPQPRLHLLDTIEERHRLRANKPMLPMDLTTPANTILATWRATLRATRLCVLGHRTFAYDIWIREFCARWRTPATQLEMSTKLTCRASRASIHTIKSGQISLPRYHAFQGYEETMPLARTRAN
ncbi:hypothetical protein EJ03DRAFT_170179 [Teratosphaeria nubilosa]|uniref:Uncharacterized protein n=1 Tax=Teratosphaeria nubilosa TaxID=161662 RepID=A0A6G1LJH7_9PEZI|nr:hypothetical protein EJ03DRAFT_170179 [Teratosphaeria nubilosa]